jgi:hypothetical protein
MNTPLTTAEIVERLKETARCFARDDRDESISFDEQVKSYVEWSAASALLALEGERDASQRAHEHTKYWYSVRLERLKDLGKELGIWPAMAAIIANGTADPAEPPTYAQAFNLMLHRAETAEAELAKVRTATVETLSMCERYADFIRTSVKADDIEMHPYLPGLESIIERAKLASPAEPAAIASSPAPEPKQGEDGSTGKFRSKIVEIEAWCNSEDLPHRSAVPNWLRAAFDARTVRPDGIAYHHGYYIETLEGTMHASYGDWIIRGTEGELYPCKPSVFARKYEPAAPTSTESRE